MDDIRPIPGHEGYFCSSDGRGRVFSRRRGAELRELARFDRLNRRCEKTGYLSVQLGRGTIRYVHRLVLETFVGPAPSAEHEGCHGNGDRGDNRVANLRWGTPAENTIDRHAHGRIPRGNDEPAHAFADLLDEVRDVCA